MFFFHVNNCCGRKWVLHFCLVEVVRIKKIFKNAYTRPYYLMNKSTAKLVLKRMK